MGHKVSPYANRLGINEYWRSRWFFRKNFKVFLEADYLIRKIISERLKKSAGIIEIIIERKDQEHCRVIIRTAKPGNLIGREGQKLKRLQEEIKKRLEILFNKYKVAQPALEIVVEEVKKPTLYANFLAQLIAIDIEKNKSVRSVMKKAIERARQNKEVKGIKIRVSGRIGGASIHRSEVLSWGRLPLSTLKAKIDYACIEALTKYGIIGVKVWLVRGENKEYKED
ncbi:MAG: 30S ribosomal protein S3 [Patescibacteria group bacterium]|nr:30S ribosomal protein S3 [Patescibacteria group bacterium]